MASVWAENSNDVQLLYFLWTVNEWGSCNVSITFSFLSSLTYLASGESGSQSNCPCQKYFVFRVSLMNLHTQPVVGQGRRERKKHTCWGENPELPPSWPDVPDCHESARESRFHESLDHKKRGCGLTWKRVWPRYSSNKMHPMLHISQGWLQPSSVGWVGESKEERRRRERQLTQNDLRRTIVSCGHYCTVVLIVKGGRAKVDQSNIWVFHHSNVLLLHNTERVCQKEDS